MNAKAYSLDAYVLDVLMRDLVGHDRRPAAYLVYLALTVAAGEGRTFMSHSRLAEHCGLSRRSVQDAVRHLADRGLLAISHSGPTDVLQYEPLRPWRS